MIETPILINAGEFGRVTRAMKEETQREMMNRLMPMNSDLFATQAMAQARRNRAIIVVPRWWKIVWWINRLCIPLAGWIAAKGFVEMKTKAEQSGE